VALLEDIMARVRDSDNNPALTMDAILVTMYDNRTLHSREVMEMLRDKFEGKLLRTEIPRTVKFSDATVSRTPITKFAPDSAAAEAYRAVARELVDRGCAP